MSTEKRWFTRYGSGLTLSIRPSAPQGWMMTLAYAVAVTLLANAATYADRGDWLPWAALIVGLTAIYLVLVWRLSEPQS